MVFLRNTIIACLRGSDVVQKANTKFLGAWPSLPKCSGHRYSFQLRKGKVESAQGFYWEEDMSANAKRHWPPNLSPTQSEAVPTWRAAYSDRISALMALFCEFAHDTFVADQAAADQSAAPTVAGEAGRNELKRRLEAGSFQLVRVFNEDRGFLAVREGHFAVLAFRGTEGMPCNVEPTRRRHTFINGRLNLAFAAIENFKEATVHHHSRYSG